MTDLLILLENVEKGFPSLLCQLLPVRRGRGFCGGTKKKKNPNTPHYMFGTRRDIPDLATQYNLFVGNVLFEFNTDVISSILGPVSRQPERICD